MNPRKLRDMEFAVVDVETTGLFPKLDRVVEIAVLRTNAEGAVLASLETLVNPERDLGPTGLHGIWGGDVAHAPRFGDIAEHLLGSLSGTLLVGHNIRFDLAFLSHEFLRVGTSLPELPCVCTLQMAMRQKLPVRGLGPCCRALGLELKDAHSAAADAHATATLFASLLETGNYDTVEDLGCISTTVQFKKPPTIPRLCPRTEAAAHAREEHAYLASLVGRLTGGSGPASSPNIECYLELVDRYLEDRKLEPHEAEGLVNLASEFGMSRADAMAAHAAYFNRLLQVALEDNVLTDSERRDLTRVARLLGLDDSVVVGVPSPTAATQAVETSRQQEDLKAKTVCFTGQTHLGGEPISREVAEQLATQAGLIVLPRVTKKLDILVVADPDSLSGKAKKAREYGIRIIADVAFWQIIGVKEGSSGI
jgi:DNA polymerase-3 subunit epsilon